MPTNPKLENYLSSLERALKPLPVSDRAEIVTEIKSHVLSALERDPQQSTDQILNALGEPETVANRYLLERGQAPVKPPISPIVKWLVVAFLGTLAMVLLFLGMLAWKFAPAIRPLIQVDERNEHVSILGGLIDVRGDSMHFEGAKPLAPGEKRPIEVRFSLGKVELSNSDPGKPELSWSCRSRAGSPAHRGLAETPQALLLDFTREGGIRCEIRVPEKAKVLLQGDNGKVALEQVHFNTEIQLGTGKVLVDPDPARAYRYDVAVQTGKSSGFTSSSAADAHEVKIRLQVGKIGLSDDSSED